MLNMIRYRRRQDKLRMKRKRRRKILKKINNAAIVFKIRRNQSRIAAADGAFMNFLMELMSTRRERSNKQIPVIKGGDK